MLSSLQFEAYLHRLALPEPGRAYINAVRTSPPSRAVNGGHRSATVRYPTETLHLTLTVESRSHEYAYARITDHDRDVLEIWEQPIPIRVVSYDRTDRRHGYWYTPDFLVLRSNRAELVEVKPTGVIEKRADKKPRDWVVRENRWHFVPAEQAVAPLGISHITVSTDEINSVLARNISFLAAYGDLAATPLDPDVAADLRAAVHAKPGITIARLLPPHADRAAEHIYAAILQSVIYAPIDDFDLSDTVRCPLFIDETYYRLVVAIDKDEQGGPKLRFRGL